MDIIKQLGEAALGSRLKRLSDRWAKDAATFYRMNNIDFEPRWFPVFYALTQSDTPLSIMDLAEQTGFSHPAIIQFVRELEQNGFVLTEKSRKDARRRLVSLSEKATEMLPQLRMVWAVVSEEIMKIIKQQRHNILFAIEEVEEILDRENYLQNLANNLKMKQLDDVEILDYAPEFQPYFKSLNVEWIQKYFRIEPSDEAQLDHPEEHIIDKGGRIFFARYKGEIVGTVGVIKDSETLYELVKMAVSPKAQGLQIGKKLALHAIEQSRLMGGKKIWLESNTILTPAIELYKRVGFYKVELQPSPYARANIQMEREL